MHILSRQKEPDPWITGKTKDDIKEVGYGGAPVRIKSDQEPAIVDVQRAVIAKRGNAPTTPVNSPVGDSQSNGRVENAIKKVRNMVKTILSSLESRWGIRVIRDHPVHPWVFEWAADQVCTRGRFGKDSSSIDSWFKVKQKQCTIRREDLVHTAETIWSSSRKHGGHILGWHLSGHEAAIK